MFGYVVINKPELKCREFEEYRAFYCGLCQILKEKYGISGQMALSYDLTFLTILLSGLYEPGTRKGKCRCIVHPLQKQTLYVNECTEYAADMTLILTYYKCLDDWKDEKKLLRYLYAKLLLGRDKKLSYKYRKKIKTIVSLLRELSAAEEAGEKNIDKMAGYFGKIMAEIFAYREDVWEETLRKTGFYLGKFIYLIDAYEDLEEDARRGNYNPLAQLQKQEDFDERIREILTMMMAACSREFEILPVLKYADIIRNILYSGVWCRYVEVRKRKEGQEKNHDRSI
ncbi:MAG TPA: hypothetical protein IAA44_03180 [Candidatus Blautia avistercoris]|uniref:DUF5685 family protein n=1 Tax=Blautia sp. An249 TaxID=1965603 RepID=UPI000B3AB87A|nr:DUF5685 family protein [Blautia sp. An249]OUO76595.1 hypothetical protein B5F53_16615 [Blautia sp. An249]HIY18385.1 hypothetical protein [Candidatus Blautia avistercoris]